MKFVLIAEQKDFPIAIVQEGQGHPEADRIVPYVSVECLEKILRSYQETYFPPFQALESLVQEAKNGLP